MVACQVLAQLRASGVLASIQISAAGLPCRMLYSDFVLRYQMLLASSEWSLPGRTQVQTCVKRFCQQAEEVRFGRTKVFMKDWQLSTLESHRLRRNSAASLLQSLWRMRQGRLYFQQWKKAALRVALWWKLLRCHQRHKAAAISNATFATAAAPPHTSSLACVPELPGPQVHPAQHRVTKGCDPSAVTCHVSLGKWSRSIGRGKSILSGGVISRHALSPVSVSQVCSSIFK